MVSPVAEPDGQLLSKRLAEGRLPGTRRPMQQHRPVEGDQVGVDALLPKMQRCAGVLQQPFLDILHEGHISICSELGFSHMSQMHAF